MFNDSTQTSQHHQPAAYPVSFVHPAYTWISHRMPRQAARHAEESTHWRPWTTGTEQRRERTGPSKPPKAPEASYVVQSVSDVNVLNSVTECGNWPGSCSHTSAIMPRGQVTACTQSCTRLGAAQLGGVVLRLIHYSAASRRWFCSTLLQQGDLNASCLELFVSCLLLPLSTWLTRTLVLQSICAQ